MDWMGNKDEINCSAEGIEVEIQEIGRTNKQASTEDEEEEYVAPCHKTNSDDNNAGDIQMHTVHANDNVAIPRGSQTKPIKDFMEIAKNKGQETKMLKFPPIDHDNPIS